MKGSRAGPGIAKTGGHRIIRFRQALLARCVAGVLDELVDRADVVSEGAARDEGAGRTWYGSTSLILNLSTASPEARDLIATSVGHDPVVRLKAMRLARREASLRAPGPLGVSRCEIRVAGDPAGVRIDVDVEAPLIEGHASHKTR